MRKLLFERQRFLKAGAHSQEPLNPG
jgi:hypothetical protein